MNTISWLPLAARTSFTQPLREKYASFSGAHHFVLVVDGGAPAHQMLHDFEVALGGGSLQGRVSGLEGEEIQLIRTLNYKVIFS